MFLNKMASQTVSQDTRQFLTYCEFSVVFYHVLPFYQLRSVSCVFTIKIGLIGLDEQVGCKYINVKNFNISIWNCCHHNHCYCWRHL